MDCCGNSRSRTVLENIALVSKKTYRDVTYHLRLLYLIAKREDPPTSHRHLRPSMEEQVEEHQQRNNRLKEEQMQQKLQTSSRDLLNKTRRTTGKDIGQRLL
ncbi:unnamed protein product, partial [Mesorhabditis spiculigera]